MMNWIWQSVVIDPHLTHQTIRRIAHPTIRRIRPIIRRIVHLTSRIASITVADTAIRGDAAVTRRDVG
jgi:hypothetical protein